jgi:hypothetical protein
MLPIPRNDSTDISRRVGSFPTDRFLQDADVDPCSEHRKYPALRASCNNNSGEALADIAMPGANGRSEEIELSDHLIGDSSASWCISVTYGRMRIARATVDNRSQSGAHLNLDGRVRLRISRMPEDNLGGCEMELTMNL